MSYNHSPKLDDSLSSLKKELIRNNQIKLDDYHRYDVKRGLRNSDGTGVMAGLSRICSVEGYYIDDGERVPKEGKLIYRGINMTDIVRNCQKENRFGYEEVVWLLLLGDLPTQDQLDKFRAVLAEARELPDEFIEDMIMKAPSPNIMNKVARSVLALYSYDNNPDDLSIENVLRQSIKLIAQIPHHYVICVSGKAQSIRPQEYVYPPERQSALHGGVHTPYNKERPQVYR